MMKSAAFPLAHLDLLVEGVLDHFEINWVQQDALGILFHWHPHDTVCRRVTALLEGSLDLNPAHRVSESLTVLIDLYSRFNL